MITFALIFLLLETVICENKFRSNVRNLTNTNNDNENHGKRNITDENALKSEIAKYINECRSDENDNYSYDSEQKYGSRRYTDKSDKHDGSSGTYPDHYGNKQIHNRNQRNSGNDKNNDDKNIDAYLTSYGNNQNDQRNRNFRKENSRTMNRSNRFNNRNDRGEENVETSYSQSQNRNNPYDSNNRDYGGSNYDNGQNSNRYPNVYRSRDYETYNVEGVEYRGANNYPNINPSLGRWKRESDNCISQCIFGYLELLDENNMPSETATIKFIQDRMQNDRKRLKLVRDTRRCFAKMATSETEDGCELSKILGKCLNLTIE